MKLDKNDKRLGRKMLAIYRETDPAVQARATQLGATCRPGCSACCSLLVSVTFPEAVAVAEALLTDPAHTFLLRGLLPRLHAQISVIVDALKLEQPERYFEAKLPCVLLDPKTHTCAVYAARPSACRLRYTTADPVGCEKGSVVDLVDMSPEGLQHLNEAKRGSNQTQTPLWSGPFQLMLLWALKLLSEGRASIEAAHARPETLGALSLHLWRVGPPT